MFKKLSLTLVLSLLIGCSNLPTKDVSLSPQEQALRTAVDVGNLDKATELLTQLEPILEAKKSENYQTLISERDQEIKDLEKLINILEDAISKNHFFIIERYADMGIKNTIKLNKLKKLDLSQGSIYTGKPVLERDKAQILAVINFYDESLYLDIFFIRKNGKWKITNFSERG